MNIVERAKSLWAAVPDKAKKHVKSFFIVVAGAMLTAGVNAADIFFHGADLTPAQQAMIFPLMTWIVNFVRVETKQQ
jgi:hypothetical protein